MLCEIITRGNSVFYFKDGIILGFRISYRGTTKFINSAWHTESLRQQFIFRIF